MFLTNILGDTLAQRDSFDLALQDARLGLIAADAIQH
jgi:hypothetical protein